MLFQKKGLALEKRGMALEKRAWRRRRTMIKLAMGKAIDCILKKVFIASKNAQHA